MDNGQADSAPETDGLAGLVGFLSDTPEKEPKDDEPLNAEDAPDEETADEANDESDDDEPGDEPADDDKPAPVETKVTFKVKAEDGTEETVEFSPEELPAALMRQRDYTKKTVALAERENQAVQFLQSKH